MKFSAKLMIVFVVIMNPMVSASSSYSGVVANSGSSTTAGNTNDSTQKRRQHAPTLYLKEILLGRCYESPPSAKGRGTNNDAQEICPKLVSRLMYIFNTFQDEQITIETYNDATSFYFYFNNHYKYSNNNNMADFTSPKDSALFYTTQQSRQSSRTLIPSSQRSNTLPSLLRHDSSSLLFVTPETTHGGRLMYGLVFCGLNNNHEKMNNCPLTYYSIPPSNYGNSQRRRREQEAQEQQQQEQQQEEEEVEHKEEEQVIIETKNTKVRGAQASFWIGTYIEFAKHASGHVRTIITLSSNGMLFHSNNNNNDSHYYSSNSNNVQNDNDDVLTCDIFITYVLPNLNPKHITSFDLYVLLVDDDNDNDTTEEFCNSHNDVVNIGRALEEHGIQNISCIEFNSQHDIIALLLCSNNDSSSDSSTSKLCSYIKNVDKENDNQNNHHPTSSTARRSRHHQRHRNNNNNNSDDDSISIIPIFIVSLWVVGITVVLIFLVYKFGNPASIFDMQYDPIPNIITQEENPLARKQ